MKFPRRLKNHLLHPDEIFLDARLSTVDDAGSFDRQLEKPISRQMIVWLGVFFVLIGLAFLSRIGWLQIVDGEDYAVRADWNTLRHTPILPDRGIIYDRRGIELAWNKPERTYLPLPGFGHLLGYLGFPPHADLEARDYTPNEMVGRDGVEQAFNDVLGGRKGLRIEEVDVHGNIISDHHIEEAENGKPLTLAVDNRVQAQLHKIIAQTASERGFQSGAGIVMDVRTGEIIALVSHPEYDPNIMTSRSQPATITRYLSDPANIFVDRAIAGLYTPGSVFKPILAVAALEEKIITPEKKILSTGQLTLPNPYNPKAPTIFRDWKAHGWVNLREALAVSSDVYFYQVGGGFEGQPGLGIGKIGDYARMFGIASTTGIELLGESKGLIPSPEWKEANFAGEPWRIGDTYHTSIGQYGVLVTPIEILRMTAAIANGGYLLRPTILAVATSSSARPADATLLPFAPENLQIVREGLRLSVVLGTAKGLNTSVVDIAAKTGTAELGLSKANVNSWVTGFFPYQDPHYAFVVVMERGKRENTIGGVFVIRTLIDWMGQHVPEYFH